MVAALVVVVAGVVWADHAIGGRTFDRALAIDRAVDASGDQLTAAQAACYVDRARTVVGSRYLEPDASIPASVQTRLAAIRDDCVGLGALASGQPVGVPVTEAGDLPMHHGDDAALDQLWTRCAAGYGSACDDLFAQSPIGSQYEQFALSCGGRTSELRCAAVYRAPGVTATSPTQVPSPPRSSPPTSTRPAVTTTTRASTPTT